jgi:hypothetical protein
MANELSKALMCIQMRSGVEIWVEQEKVGDFQKDLEQTTQHFFARFAGQTVNTADVVGVFSASTMDEYTRRKNGQWKCDKGNWHDRGVKCDCPSRAEKDYQQKRAEAIAKCKKGCKEGWIEKPDGAMAVCSCVARLQKSS